MGKPQARRAPSGVVADLTPEAIDRLLERLAKAGKGALVRGVDDITKLLESYQPRKPAYKGPHLTDAQYTELLDRQGGSCAICKDKPRDRLVVDHDHESGAGPSQVNIRNGNDFSFEPVEQTVLSVGIFHQEENAPRSR